MSPIGSVNPLNLSALLRTDAPAPAPRLGVPAQGSTTATATEGFGRVLDGIVGSTEAKGTSAENLTRQVLLGDSDQLHQSVIAMQEASVAFTMMIEVRNKLVESYQELMRMQV